jgi:hypothetical protein
MATTTPNFGWPVPTSTDLVKDGATAIEALGDGIDTSLVDLKGGTTGQLLSKTSNTDMDFTWGGSWTTYTPTINAGFTLGNGTQVFRYVKIGKTVFVQGTILWGSTTSMTAFDFTLPSTSATTQYGTNAVIGEFSAQDAFTASYHGFMRWLNSTTVLPRTIAASTVTGAITGFSLTATTPFTWTTNDVMNFNFVYEEA